MNTNTNSLPSSILIFLLLITLLFACKNDDDVTGGDAELPAFYVEGALMNCPGEVTDLSEVSFQINQAYEYEDLIICGGFSDMAIYNTVTEELTEIDTIGVNHFLEFEGKLMICAEKGLYSMNAEESIALEADDKCLSALINSDGMFLFTSNSDDILTWDTTMGVMPYGDPYESNYIGMDNLTELNNGEIWATTAAGKIARFENQLFLGLFDGDDIPMSEFVTDAPMFMAAYDEGAILVTKNGQLYQIFKYTNNQEWVTLFDSENITSSDENTAITQPSITDILIRDDKLYVSTTIASCKGFQVFDITKNELLSPDDYHPQYDPNLDSQCIHGLDYGANGDVITVSNNQVLFYDCN